MLGILTIILVGLLITQDISSSFDSENFQRVSKILLVPTVLILFLFAFAAFLEIRQILS
jgi:hypothetical protein